MKILAELVSVNQKWIPDTGEYINVVVFSYAGVITETVVTEAQAASVVKQSQAELNGRLTQPLKVAVVEREFGGDLDLEDRLTEEEREELVAAPPTFQEPPAAESTRERMRKRAEFPERGDPDGFPQG